MNNNQDLNNNNNLNDLEVLDNNNNVIVRQESMPVVSNNDDVAWNVEQIEDMAKNAERVTLALKKIMNATIGITSEKDWVLIGGTPYLQESGATAVASMHGISIQILATRAENLGDGFKKFIYTIRATKGNRSIDVEGERSMKDSFFNPKGKLKAEEVNEGDVRKAAYTNAVNNAIKRIIPGLRNLSIQDLERAGLQVDKMAGYTFKSGSKGGTSSQTKETGSGLHCEVCGKEVSQKVASYTQAKFGKILCFDCQGKQGKQATTTTPNNGNNQVKKEEPKANNSSNNNGYKEVDNEPFDPVALYADLDDDFYNNN